MAQSESTVTETEEYHVEYVGGGDEHRLVVQTPAVTITVEGESEEVRRQFEQQYAAAVGRTPEEIEPAVTGRSMPEPDELDSMSAGKFYDG